MAKDVSHLWELGGGISLAKLIEIPITAECLRQVHGLTFIRCEKFNAIRSDTHVPNSNSITRTECSKNYLTNQGKILCDYIKLYRQYYNAEN